MKNSKNRYLGITLALTALVLFELAILSTNYYLSHNVDKNAESINISGRQRMLSQRITKSLFDAKINYDQIEQYDDSINELKFSSNLFNQTIIAFADGGPITTASGNESEITAIADPDTHQIVLDGLAIWSPFKEKIDRVLDSVSTTRDDRLTDALNFAEKNNLGLLKLMNDLTIGLESEATARSNLLKLIQTLGFIGLSLMFFAIVFFFIRKLKSNDTELSAARNETKQILETVDEGLFLVNKDLTISEQQSTKLKEIFNTDATGKPLIKFLDGFISSKDRETTKEYFGLLFDQRKAETLIGDLNPLKEVNIQLEDGNSQVKRKTVNFAFKRVVSENEIDKILTTISDITEEVELREELNKLEQEKNNQFEMLSTILNTDRQALDIFVKNSKSDLKEINTLLKSDSLNSTELKDKASSIMTIVHGIKGESAALEITSLSAIAKEFEVKADELIQTPKLSGENFIPPFSDS